MTLLLLHPGASWSTADVEAGLRYGLEQHGVKIIRFRFDERINRSKTWLFAAWRKARRKNPAIEKPTAADVFYQAGIGALEMALRHQVDAVVIVSAMFVHPDLVIMMRRAGLRVVVLFTESPYDTDKESEFAKLVDGCWTNERSSVDRLIAVNPRSGYLPHGWHPMHHRPGPLAGDDELPAHDVVFVGSAFRERIAWLSAIDWAGIDFGLYGNWSAVPSRHPLRRFIKGGAIPNTATAALYRRAKIGLNLYRTSMGFGMDAPQIAHAESLNPRAYELAASGAFHLSTPRAEVAEVFGTLVPTVSTAEEASEKLRYWLRTPDARLDVQAQLPARVAESSWVHRASQVVGDIQSLLQHSRAA